MSIKRFFSVLFLQWLVLFILKIVFFHYLGLDNANLQSLIYWILTIILSAALVRRLGIINYLEAIFAAIVWFAVDIVLDLVITTLFTGLKIFSSWQFWVGYALVAISVFLWHKKRHIAIRRGTYVHHEHH